jgi:S1-C subfamily serine protease
MRLSLRLVVDRAALLIAAALLVVFSPNFTQAADVHYSTIGWWQITYREVDDSTGCEAKTEFQDQTRISIDLIQADDGKSWIIFISNPNWDSWIAKKKQHFLWVVGINPNKVWRTNWSATENGKEIFTSARVEFINSLADAKAVAIYDENKRSLLALPLNMKDSEDAIRAVVNCVRDHPLNNPPVASSSPKSSPASSSGTAFFAAPNLLVTNNHVVKECGAIEVRYPDHRWFTATIEGQDNTNDLALLHTDMENLSVASFRLQSRVGEPVAAYGFPYAGLLSSSGNFTMGNVAALAGMDDDSRFIQISAQVQPGNSGGPLLDLSGSVIGVISSRLNAIKMMREGGDVPQNVNFAIQAPIVVNFLSAKGVSPKWDSSVAHGELPPADVADLAKKITVQVFCPAVAAAKISEAAPPASASPSSAFEEKAKAFVLSLQAQWSKPNAEALAGLDALYEDEVMYYGKITKKNAVIKEKQAFARKFPKREYRPREPISISCSDRVCTVRGVLDYRSINPVAKIVSEGVASFEYQLILSGTTLTISLENGEVLSRTKTSLSRVSTYEGIGNPASPVSAHPSIRGATWQIPR